MIVYNLIGVLLHFQTIAAIRHSNERPFSSKGAPAAMTGEPIIIDEENQIIASTQKWGRIK